MNDTQPWHRWFVIAALAVMGATTAGAHHSFSGFDKDKTKSVTGVVRNFNTDANHVVMYITLVNGKRSGWELGAGGEPVTWRVEFEEGSAAASQLGISRSTFEDDKTIVTLTLHPARNVQRSGARVPGSPVHICPGKTLPRPGKHCDSVEGHRTVGIARPPDPRK